MKYHQEYIQKKYEYNDKGQITKITSKEETIKIEYDKNGNMISKINNKGEKEEYKYNEYNQLESLKQGQYIYQYKYDANNERIESKKIDSKEYHYDKWYDYVEEIVVVSKEEFEDTFDRIKAQIEIKESNGNKCEVRIAGNKEISYYKEDEETRYILDRSVENSVVLAVNEEINIYNGNQLLQVEDDIKVTGLNQSIVASVEDFEVKRYSYSDYGVSSNIERLGYNGEVKDETGLIYLRARYYDPSIARFIQIDVNYVGEQEQVNTQNRYIYTLNNPYKYVDRDGNRSVVGTGLKIDFLNNEKNKILANAKASVRNAMAAVENFVNSSSMAIKVVAKILQPPIKNVKQQLNHLIYKISDLQIIACPQNVKTKLEIYSFSYNMETSMLIKNAKSSALNFMAGVDKADVHYRMKESLKYFDNTLSTFKGIIGYVVGKMLINMDEIITAMLDIIVQIIREYTEPIFIDYGYIPISYSSADREQFAIYEVIGPIKRNLDFMKLVNTDEPLDIKSREGWSSGNLGSYYFDCAVRSNDYLGNMVYGVAGKEMFGGGNLNIGNLSIGSDSYLINMAGLAQQVSNTNKKGLPKYIEGATNWIWIRISSGLNQTGDNPGDTEMIKEGIERWHRDYGKK